MLFLVLVGENAVEKWNSGLGNVDPQLDRDNNSNSIRARYSPLTVQLILVKGFVFKFSG